MMNQPNKKSCPCSPFIEKTQTSMVLTSSQEKEVKPVQGVIEGKETSSFRLPLIKKEKKVFSLEGFLSGAERKDSSITQPQSGPSQEISDSPLSLTEKKLTDSSQVGLSEKKNSMEEKETKDTGFRYVTFRCSHCNSLIKVYVDQ